MPLAITAMNDQAKSDDSVPPKLSPECITTSGTAKRPSQMWAAIQKRALPSGKPRIRRRARNHEVLRKTRANSNRQIAPDATPNTIPGHEPPPGSRPCCHPVQANQPAPAQVATSVMASQARCREPNLDGKRSTGSESRTAEACLKRPVL